MGEFHKKCPYCAEDIRTDAILCKHCKSDLTGRKQKEDSKKQSGGCLTGCGLWCLLIFVLLPILANALIGKSTNPTQSSAAPPQATSRESAATRAVYAGDEGVLRIKEGSAWLPNPLSEQRFNEAAQANDSIGLAQLAEAGLIHKVAHGDRVLDLGAARIGKRKIRMLSGASFGEALICPYEWVVRPPQKPPAKAAKKSK